MLAGTVTRRPGYCGSFIQGGHFAASLDWVDRAARPDLRSSFCCRRLQWPAASRCCDSQAPRIFARSPKHLLHPLLPPLPSQDVPLNAEKTESSAMLSPVLVSTRPSPRHEPASPAGLQPPGARFLSAAFDTLQNSSIISLPVLRGHHMYLWNALNSSLHGLSRISPCYRQCSPSKGTVAIISCWSCHFNGMCLRKLDRLDVDSNVRDSIRGHAHFMSPGTFSLHSRYVCAFISQSFPPLCRKHCFQVSPKMLC